MTRLPADFQTETLRTPGPCSASVSHRPKARSPKRTCRAQGGALLRFSDADLLAYIERTRSDTVT